MASSKLTYGKMWASRPARSTASYLPDRGSAGKRRFALHSWLLIVLLAFTLSGCVTLNDPEASHEYTADMVGSISVDQQIGQTFVARRTRLNGITIWFSADAGPQTNETLTFELYRAGEDTPPVFSTAVSTSGITENSSRYIAIPVQSDPAGQAYYLKLTTTSPTAVQVQGRNEDTYPNGQAYINEQPVNADLAFRLTYDFDTQAAFEDLLYWLEHGWLFLLIGLVLFLPGWLLLDLTGLAEGLDGGEQAALAVGLSLAIIPIIMLWSTTLGLHWNEIGVRIAVGVLVALGLIRWLPRGLRSIRQRRSTDRNETAPTAVEGPRDKAHLVTGLALTAICLAALGLRLSMQRDLAAPAWIDSVHHTLITRLVLEQGGMPQTYAPYLDIDPTFYHAGFHANLAVFHWLSGLDLSAAMLLLGQVHNALMALAVYALTVTLTKDRLAGVFAALVTSFLTPMPVYYTSWGRYTQLAGLLILPAALAFARLWIAKVQIKSEPGAGQPPRREITRQVSLILLSGIILGGLFLVHYRVILFALCLVGPYLLAQLDWKRSAVLQSIRSAAIYLFLSGLVAILLALPWLIPALTRTFVENINAALSPNARWFGDFAWRYLTAALGREAMALCGLGLAWSLLRRQHFGIVLTAWVVLLFALANLDVLRIPGGGFINNSSVTITLFIPIAILAGYIASEITHSWLGLHSTPLWRWSASLIILALSLVGSYAGARQLMPIFNPGTLLARQADLQAMDWIKSNIPEDETILINPFLWGYNLYAGSDGGYWISPLTGRRTIPPPAIYGLSSPETVQQINATCLETINRWADAQGLWDYLHAQNIRFVYVGRRGGVLSPQVLSESGLFIQRYAQSGVWIFELAPVNAK